VLKIPIVGFRQRDSGGNPFTELVDNFGDVPPAHPEVISVGAHCPQQG
jgi:hypothetical protein